MFANILEASLSQSATLGRKYLHDLYTDSGKKKDLIQAVEKYIKDIKFFDTNCALLENGAPARYNFRTHEFEYDDSQHPQKFDVGMVKRDYVIHCIKRLAVRLFSIEDISDSGKNHCVENFLFQKVFNKNVFLCEKMYIENANASDQKKGEQSLNKFLNKILSGNFLSAEQKILNHGYLINKESKVNAVETSITLIGEEIQVLTDEKEINLKAKSSNWSHFNFTAAVADVLKMIESHNPFSDIGKQLKQALVGELVVIQTANKKYQDFDTLKLKTIFSKDMTNRFPDEICLKLEIIKKYILEVEQYNPEKQQLQEQLKEEKLKLKEIKSEDTPKIKTNKKESKASEKKASNPSRITWFFNRVAQIFKMIGKWFSNLWTKLFS